MNVALGEEEVGGVLGVDVGDAVLVAVDVDGRGQAVAGQGDAEGGFLALAGRLAGRGQSQRLLAVGVGKGAAGGGHAAGKQDKGQDGQNANDD